MATLMITVDTSELMAVLEEEIPWEGNLEDDCSARWRSMIAHVECLGCHCECGEVPGSFRRMLFRRLGIENEQDLRGTETWYWSVTRINPDCPCENRTPEQKGIPLECTCEQLWHTGENSGYTTNGEGARRFAELVMRLGEVERLTGARLETRRIW